MENKRIHFTSMDLKKYTDMDMDFRVIQKPAEALPYFTDLNKVVATKDCKISARRAVEGEKVTTGPIVEIGGKKYRFVEAEKVITKEMADAGAMIITNPDGEQYFNKTKADFEKRYGEIKAGGKQAEYQTCGDPQSFYTATENVFIMKSEWGEGAFQVVPAGSKVNVTEPDNPYSVTNSAFDATYKVNPVQGTGQNF
ncbi:MAG: hypothetical protein LBN07_00955 [Christensenellaceae bacterium]|nr:hypothetical protein [Christensenellaceae bacterium]